MVKEYVLKLFAICIEKSIQFKDSSQDACMEICY